MLNYACFFNFVPNSLYVFCEAVVYLICVIYVGAFVFAFCCHAKEIKIKKVTAKHPIPFLC